MATEVCMDKGMLKSQTDRDTVPVLVHITTGKIIWVPEYVHTLIRKTHAIRFETTRGSYIVTCQVFTTGIKSF